MASTFISSYLLYPPNLPDKYIRAISGALINDLFIDQPIPYEKYGDMTYEEEFLKKRVPENKIIKMSKTEYIDDFFKNGKLQLGTFEYYIQFNNPEIGDKSEGSFLIVGENLNNTAFAEIASGFENYVFCCYDGEPSQEIIEKFGYNDYFEIMDFDGFSEAIKKSIYAENAYYSKCIYKKHKVLIGKTTNDFNFHVVSEKLKELVNETKYFLKTNDFSHQNEFRFTWEMKEDVVVPIIIECKEAVKYCRRKLYTKKS